jgi:hypothetical protein
MRERLFRLIYFREDRNGYPPFPATLVISAPRSGLNLIRHAVESAGNRRTPGIPHLLRRGPLAFHRSHSADSDRISGGRARLNDSSGSPLYSKLMLLLRDPFEILPRSYNSNLERMSEYCDNILAINKFNGEKMLIFYDDLVTDDSIFNRIFRFLDLDNPPSLKDVPEIRASSVSWYEMHQAKGGGSRTKGAPTALRQHQQPLTEGERRELRAFLDQHLGDLVDVYLSRWLA